MGKLQVKYDSVANDLRRRILCGEFVSELPGVKKLALEYDVNFMTVDKALNCLEKENLIYRLPRKGTFVRCRRNILLAICDRDERLLENQFYAPLINGIQQRLLAENCFMISCNLYGMKKSRRENLLRRVDGTLAINSETVKLCLSENKPVIKILGEEEPAAACDHFTYCSQKVGAIAAEYLKNKGAKNPAYLGFNDKGVFCDRRDGFLEKCTQEGMKASDFSCATVCSSKQYSTLCEQLEKMLASGCDGVFASSDTSAITVSTVLVLKGYRLPVIGCNNNPQRKSLARECVPATISLNTRTIGCQAAQRLLQRIDGNDFPPEKFVFEPVLIDINDFREE